MTYEYGKLVNAIQQSLDHQYNHGSGGYENFQTNYSGSVNFDQGTWNSLYSDYRSY